MHSGGGRLRTIRHQTDAPLNCHFLNVSIGEEERALISDGSSLQFICTIEEWHSNRQKCYLNRCN